MASTQQPATWLASVLRTAGVTVVEEPGWKTRGRPPSTGIFLPIAVLMHHDASSKGPTPGEPKYLVKGRPLEGDPGPLCNVWISQGKAHLIAAGRSNHGGKGKGYGVIKRDQANGRAIGIEWDHTPGEPLTPEDHLCIVKTIAAILAHLEAKPSNALAGHLEYAAGRKFDPDKAVLPMGQLRTEVTAQMATELPTVSLAAVVKAFKTKGRDPGVKIVKRALHAHSFLKHWWTSDKVGFTTVAAMKAAQVQYGFSGPRDGIPTAGSLTRLLEGKAKVVK